MQVLAIQHATSATPAEAIEALARAFPVAGTYHLRGGGRRREVSFSDAPSRAADPLTLWQALFPVDGDYLVKAITTRGVVVHGKRFEEWWLERLVAASREQFVDLRAVVRRAVELFIQEHGGSLADPTVLQRFERLLFDLRQGMRWAVAQPVTPGVEAVLRELGFEDRHVLDFPGVAYRLGMLSDELAKPGAKFSWPEALAMAAKAPVMPSDELAISYLRQRAGTYLSPVVTRPVQALHVAAMEREQQLLRTMAAEAVGQEMHPRAFARQLYKRFNEEGIFRDWERVARTEIGEARCLGAFAAERRTRGWTAETEIYRTLGATPCNGCLRLYRTAGGLPRVYTVAEVEAADSFGMNQGPWRTWHARVGITHPNCRDSPWLTWKPALARVFAAKAPEWAATWARRKMDA